ncbi:MAG TPA: agmatinase family protein [Longimicrobiaceae bacterium]|nr:agmatinase family protein [Longimicrobiaceae bacterium]
MTDQQTHPLADFRSTPDPRDPRAPTLLRAWRVGDEVGGLPAVIGLPYDGGIPSRPGARFGPKALRAALASFGTYSGEHELEPVVDLGDVDLTGRSGREVHSRIERAAQRVFRAGARPVFIGGDHGCTGSVIRGLAEARPELRLALITVDAHLDVREYDDEASLSSGTPFRRALETPILTGARMAMIGVRSFANSRYYLDFAREEQILLTTADEVAERGAPAIAAAALDHVTAEADALYLSVDLDAADAAVAPGVSAPGIGGLSAREMISLVGAIAASPLLVGADIMELSPPYDVDGRTARLGARLLLELLGIR